MTDRILERLSQTDCGQIQARATYEAGVVAEAKSSAAWMETSNAWQRLADAAYACECLLVREALAFTRGAPDQLPGYFNDGTMDGEVKP